jgi:hypothetical protein
MSEKRLILHAGPHKTGTTALQTALFNSRAELAAQGFTYPDIGIRHFGHHDIVTQLAGEAVKSAFTAEQVAAESVAADQIILSSEDFVYLNPARLTALKAMFPEHRFEVILFIRTPVNLWPSHWQELVRHGRADSMAEYLGAVCGWNGPFGQGFINPMTQATRFAGVFGRDAVRMFSYDNMVDSGEDIYDFFWRDVLGIKAPPPVLDQRRRNASMEAEMTEMLRSLNEAYRAKTDAPQNQFVLSHYKRHRRAIETSAEYAAFRDAFLANAAEINLTSTQEVVRNRERVLMGNFADRIENKAAPKRLHTRATFKRTIICGRRYWADRFGFSPWVNEVLRQITA